MDHGDVPSSTERLCFALWQEDDARLAANVWGDESVTRLTGGPFTPQAVEQRLAQEMENWRQYRLQYWPLFQLHEGTLIGCCGLRPRDMEARIAELGFQLCRNAWGQGYALEAANAVIDWARAHGFTSLIAGHHPANRASKRVLLHLGFSYTHDELYPPTGMVEPCYRLPL